MFYGIAKKINLLMAKEGISGMRLARRLGIPASTIKKIRSQKNTNPTVATLTPIARYFSVSLDYLLDDMDCLDFSNPSSRHYNYLPLISWEEAGQYPPIPNRLCSYVRSQYHYDSGAFALLVETLDEAVLPPNSFIIIDPTPLPMHYDFVITIKKQEQRVMLKQFLCDEEQKYLRSLDNDKKIEQFSDEYRLIGVITEFHRQRKNSY